MRGRVRVGWALVAELLVPTQELDVLPRHPSLDLVTVERPPRLPGAPALATGISCPGTALKLVEHEPCPCVTSLGRIVGRLQPWGSEGPACLRICLPLAPQQQYPRKFSAARGVAALSALPQPAFRLILFPSLTQRDAEVLAATVVPQAFGCRTPPSLRRPAPTG